MKSKSIFLLSLASINLFCGLRAAEPAWSAPLQAREMIQKSAENHLINLIKPLLDQYCPEDCKLMGAKVTLDLKTTDQISPGFEESDISKGEEIAPSSGQIRILIDDKIGPVSRSKLLELVQQYLDNLEYPVKIDTQVTHFPMPHGSEAKVAAIRGKIEKIFLSNTNDLIQQFCPRSCILSDFNLQTEVVNAEEAQYGSSGEFIQEGDIAVKIKQIEATLLIDQDLSAEDQNNILQMIRLKNSSFKNVVIDGKVLKFPRPLIAGNLEGNMIGSSGRDMGRSISSTTRDNSSSRSQSDSTSTQSSKMSSNNQENNNREEKLTRIEKTERVENGDAIQKELEKFKVAGLIFGLSILALLLLIIFSVVKAKPTSPISSIQRIIQDMTSDPVSPGTGTPRISQLESAEKPNPLPYSLRYEIERLREELSAIFGQNPKVAKYVFSRVLTEEGVETTSQYMSIFGEGIVVDMLHDPSLQSDLAELLEYHAKNPEDLSDEDKLTLLKKIYNRTISGKLSVIGNRSTHLFDFLAEMDGEQTLDLIQSESLTVKSIVLTQCDNQKRAHIYSNLDPEIRLELLTELSRIDYLPKDYIYNVATALKRKKRDNPKLNTEALPGSEVLISLLERTGISMQKTVIHSLENINPDSARTIKSKLISVDTLQFLRDGQLLEVVLSLKHDELLQFLKGVPNSIKNTIFSKSPPELVAELEEELTQIKTLSREAYQAVERKVINRVRLMASEGQVNLVETNDRMFSFSSPPSSAQADTGAAA